MPKPARTAAWTPARWAASQATSAERPCAARVSRARLRSAHGSSKATSAWFLSRPQLAAGWATVPVARRYVLTSASGTVARLAAPVIDHCRRPYEGTDVSAEAMEAYLKWEYGLIGQLERDGTHGSTAV